MTGERYSETQGRASRTQGIVPPTPSVPPPIRLCGSCPTLSRSITAASRDGFAPPVLARLCRSDPGTRRQPTTGLDALFRDYVPPLQGSSRARPLCPRLVYCPLHLFFSLFRLKRGRGRFIRNPSHSSCVAFSCPSRTPPSPVAKGRWGARFIPVRVLSLARTG